MITEIKTSSDEWPVCVCFDCTRCGCALPWRHHASPDDPKVRLLLPLLHPRLPANRAAEEENPSA